jgi:hypothetical protein
LARSTRRAMTRLNQNQARSSPDYSQPRRADGLNNRWLPGRFRLGMSIASYSRVVTYGPKIRAYCSHQLRLDRARRYAGRPVAVANQATQEGYRLVRGGRISALNSARGRNRLVDRKKASRNCLSRLALQCRGDWIRTSDLLNPIQEAWRANCLENAALCAT